MTRLVLAVVCLSSCNLVLREEAPTELADSGVVSVPLRCREIFVSNELGGVSVESPSTLALRVGGRPNQPVIKTIFTHDGQVIGTRAEPCHQGCGFATTASDGRGTTAFFGNAPDSARMSVSLVGPHSNQIFTDLPDTSLTGVQAAAYDSSRDEFALFWPAERSLMLQRRHRDGRVMDTRALPTVGEPSVDSASSSPHFYFVANATSVHTYTSDGGFAHTVDFGERVRVMKVWSSTSDIAATTVLANRGGSPGVDFVQIDGATGGVRVTPLSQFGWASSVAQWDDERQVWRAAYVLPTKQVAFATIAPSGAVLERDVCSSHHVRVVSGAVISGSTMFVSFGDEADAETVRVLRIDL